MARIRISTIFALELTELKNASNCGNCQLSPASRRMPGPSRMADTFRCDKVNRPSIAQRWLVVVTANSCLELCVPEPVVSVPPRTAGQACRANTPNTCCSSVSKWPGIYNQIRFGICNKSTSIDRIGHDRQNRTPSRSNGLTTGSRSDFCYMDTTETCSHFKRVESIYSAKSASVCARVCARLHW